jgi:hypothetical protein
MERSLTKPQIIAELTKSPHGKLEEYLPVGRAAAVSDPDFFAHLIAWNHRRGQVRDAKAALPVVAISMHKKVRDAEAAENALAHLALLDPRTLVRALVFGREIEAPKWIIRRFVGRYLRDRELWPLDRWEGWALLHRAALRTLYSKYHVPVDPMFGAQLFGGTRVNGQFVPAAPEGKFALLRDLSSMAPADAAAAIVEFKLPFLPVRNVLAGKMKDPDLLLALIKRMTPAELVTNAKTLEKLGVNTVPALRAALEEKLEKVAGSKQLTLKTTTAADEFDEDSVIGQKLRATQERQLDRMKTIEGNWLVLADKSGSMDKAIETGRQIAAMLARLVKGHVHLVFFNTSPQYVDATGLNYEELRQLTSRVWADGGTSIGCGLRAMLDKRVVVDGIAIVSDGGENTVPFFHDEYKRYCEAMNIEPTVYLYLLTGSSGDTLSPGSPIDIQKFDLRGGVDYYSLPNLVQTMRVGRYGLLDEIMATPLVTLNEVLTRTKGTEVFANAGSAALV